MFARATKSEVTATVEEFCELLRQTSVQINEGERLKVSARRVVVLPQHNAFESGTSLFRNAVLFFEA
jgi:hypothetical protein